jgi:signal transduction histidine kinase
MDTPHGLMPAFNPPLLRMPPLPCAVSALTRFQPVLLHPHRIANHVYRIAQEAVTNAVRHGKAKKIEIQLHQNSRGLHLEVRDNGKGMPAQLPAGSGMGLRIMQYRAGMFGGVVNIRNLPKGGAQVQCKVPPSQLDERGATRDTKPEKS